MEGEKKDERLGSRLCGSPSECRSNVWCNIMPQLKAKPSHSGAVLCAIERTTFLTPLKCLASRTECVCIYIYICIYIRIHIGYVYI